MSTLGSMQIRVVDDVDFATVGADAVLSGLTGAGACLGVATGGTPLRLYRELAHRTECGAIDLSSVSVVALDEYVGLSSSDPRSYASYVHGCIAGPLRIDPAATFVPDGAAADPDAEAREYEATIVGLGGVDVQIAGLGTNGHLAFNEPGTPIDGPCHVVTLSERTRRDNARYFDRRGDVPLRAITQGLGTIRRARSIVLLASGAHKGPALAAALHGPVTTDVPASVLQTHPNVTVVADRAAAALL